MFWVAQCLKNRNIPFLQDCSGKGGNPLRPVLFVIKPEQKGLLQVFTLTLTSNAVGCFIEFKTNKRDVLM